MKEKKGNQEYTPNKTDKKKKMKDFKDCNYGGDKKEDLVK